MKVLLVNGSPHQNGCTRAALDEVAKELLAQGIESEVFWLGTEPIAGCIGCAACRTNGKGCFRDDCVNEFAALAAKADGFVFGSPVHWASASGSITSFMDRLFFSAGGVMRGKPGASVVSARRAGTTAALDQLNKYFYICGMPVVPSQYWAMVHGAKSEDVQQDIEGRQTMRSLAKYMAWMLKCFAAGKAAGISVPELEPCMRTNFIR
ncbi:MAG: flavodoxin family protein [Kiritimatiellae bacterium]|nr:flavodoxin family protein [Kiritimatiellia bacterium]